MSRATAFLVCLLCAGGLGLTGCGSSTGTAIEDAGMLRSDYLVVDLASGESSPRRTIAHADPTLRDQFMAFRRVPGGTFTPGVAGAFIGDTNEKNLPETTVPAGWMGIFEVTQAQWARLSGTPAAGPGDQPACMARGSLELVLSRQRVAGRRFVLPDGDAWEWAAGAGSGLAFAWGDSLLETDAVAFAIFDPQEGSTLARPSGSAVVGSKRPNAWGLYDMQGNLWEHVAGGGPTYQACGGSWAHPLITARSSNRLALPYDAEHSLVGVRLAWDE